MCTELNCPQRGRNLTGIEALEWEAEAKGKRYCAECNQTYGIGEFPYCPHGRPHGGSLLSVIHQSERSVVYRNPKTGEIRYPARADQAIPEVYARQGYERQELSTPQAIKDFEKSTGRIHERTHYHANSATAERDLSVEPEHKKDPEVTRRLVEALR